MPIKQYRDDDWKHTHVVLIDDKGKAIAVLFFQVEKGDLITTDILLSAEMWGSILTEKESEK